MRLWLVAIIAARSNASCPGRLCSRLMNAVRSPRRRPVIELSGRGPNGEILDIVIGSTSDVTDDVLTEITTDPIPTAVVGIPVVETRSPLSNAELNTSQYRHVVVIPDVHGDAEAFRRALFVALGKVDGPVGLLPYSEFKSVFQDATARNITPPRPLSSAAPGSVALVQLGDLVDRGPDSAECIEIALKAESVLGWTVLILHGNHELQRVVRRRPEYIHPREIAAAGSNETAMEIMRDLVINKLFDKGLLMVRLSSSTPVPIDDPRNPSTLFVHAGIDLDWFLAVTQSRDMNEINQLFNDHIKVNSSLDHWYNSQNSPVWLREYERQRDESILCGFRLTTVLRRFNVARIIVGHMPQYLYVTRLCEGRILITDVGMSRWMDQDHDDSFTGGFAAAVIMRMGEDGLLDSIAGHFDNLFGNHSQTQAIFPPPPPVDWSDGYDSN